MRGLTQRLRDDTGATAVLIAIVLPVVLIGMGALVIDVGRLYVERRELQNGADAAAFAVAQDCATGPTCGAFDAQANIYADSNAEDAAGSNIDRVCGTGPGLLPCPTTPASLPAAARYVRVETSTANAAGTVIPPVLGRALNSAYNGTTVHGGATVAYGPPSGLTASLPLTISDCEFQYYKNLYGILPPPMPPASVPEAVLYFHSTATHPSGCVSSNSGADLPGGFGWLQPTSGCTATSDAGGWYDDKTGRPVPSSCDSAVLASYVGQVIALPIYSHTNGLNGSNGQYQMTTYAGFYLTGYSINGQDKVESIVTGGHHCSGSDSCIYGYFTTAVVSGGTIGSGPSGGVSVLQLFG